MTTAARLTPGDRIIVRRTATPGAVLVSTTKTGSDTAAARVLGVEEFTTRGTGHFGTVGARSRLVVETDAGRTTVPAHQTFWRADSRRRSTPTTPQEETAMTTTVRKGTNGPAAAAKRTRAAQKAPAAKPTATTPATGLPEDFPGAKKITRLLDGAAAQGWTAALSDLDPKTGAATVTVTRGEDSIRSEFIDGKSAGYSFHTLPNGKIRKLNNVSAVLHMMAGLTPNGHPLPVPEPTAEPAETPAAPPAARPARSRQRSPRPAA